MLKRSGWSSRTVIRYGLFQLPSLIILVLILLFIRHYLDLPAWAICGIVVLWVIKDMVLFPFVWRAYDRSRRENLKMMIGTQGIGEQRLAPSGYIRVHGELWKAEVMEGERPVEKGEVVQIQGIRGLVLLVQPDREENEG